MKIIAYRCPWTGKLFDDYLSYGNHLVKVRKAQRERRATARAKASFDTMVKDLHRQGSTDAIEAWLNEHYWSYARSVGFACNRWGDRERRPGPNDKVQIFFESLRGPVPCSTTHCAPRNQKTTGWGHPHIPEDGWMGRIYINFEGRGYDFFSTDQLKPLGVFTGTGGTDSRAHLGYEVTLFSKDFTGLSLMEKLSRP